MINYESNKNHRVYTYRNSCSVWLSDRSSQKNCISYLKDTIIQVMMA